MEAVYRTAAAVTGKIDCVKTVTKEGCCCCAGCARTVWLTRTTHGPYARRTAVRESSGHGATVAAAAAYIRPALSLHALSTNSLVVVVVVLVIGGIGQTDCTIVIRLLCTHMYVIYVHTHAHAGAYTQVHRRGISRFHPRSNFTVENFQRKYFRENLNEYINMITNNARNEHATYNRSEYYYSRLTCQLSLLYCQIRIRFRRRL